MGELIREAALEGVRDELPHSITVVIEEMGLREADRPEDKPLLDIHATLIVERSTPEGHRHRSPGAGSRSRVRARQQIEALLGTPVYLDLRVKIPRTGSAIPNIRPLGLLTVTRDRAELDLSPWRRAGAGRVR